jgi:zinc transport system substrate-binding protein
MRRQIVVAIAAVLLAAFGPGTAFAEPPVQVAVSVPPLAFFVERIGGPNVQVMSLIEPGRSPHSFEPTPRQIARLSKVQVFFTVGLPFEATLAKKAMATNPEMRIVDLTRGIELIGHNRGAGHEGHNHGQIDPHIWLDPKRAKKIVRNIGKALKASDSRFRSHNPLEARLIEQLGVLNQELTEILMPLRGREFLVFHPAFGYFANSYGMKQVAIEVEGKEPGPKTLARIIGRAKQTNVKVIFVQPGFSDKAARTIAKSIGAKVVPVDPLAKDYIANLMRLADALRKA